MGAVYEVDHTRLQQRFAVKFLDPEFARNAEAYARFRQEAEIAASLNHDNIVQVFDFNTDQYGNPFMVMELVEGDTLAELFSGAHAFTPEQVMGVFEPLCRALDACHAHGIVHRDLKPSNIVVSIEEHGEHITYAIKLLDFGISKIKHEGELSMTRDNVVMGTPNYMSPEQAQGNNRAVDARTDIFALGAILYEMLAGKRAFEADGLPQVLHSIVYDQPPAIGRSRRVPAPVEEVVRRCLAKQQDARFESANDMHLALRGAYKVPERPSESGGLSLFAKIAMSIVWVGTVVGVGAGAYVVGGANQVRENIVRPNPRVVTPPTAKSALQVQKTPEYSGGLASVEARLLTVDGQLYRADRAGLTHWSYPGAPTRTQVLPSAAPVTSISLSSEGTEVLVGQADGRASRWDRDLRDTLWSRRVSKHPISAIGGGGGYLVLGSENSVQLISTATGKVLRTLPGSGPPRMILMRNHESSHQVLVLRRDSLQIIDADRRVSLAKIHLGGEAMRAGFNQETVERPASLWIDFIQGDWTVRREYEVQQGTRKQRPTLQAVGQHRR